MNPSFDQRHSLTLKSPIATSTLTHKLASSINIVPRLVDGTAKSQSTVSALLVRVCATKPAKSANPDLVITIIISASRSVKQGRLVPRATCLPPWLADPLICVVVVKPPRYSWCSDTPSCLCRSPSKYLSGPRLPLWPQISTFSSILLD